MKIIFIITVIFFIPNFAFAYIDPGGLGAIFNLLIAGFVTSLFYLKSNILALFQNLRFFFKDLKDFFLFLKTKKSVVIYCENLQYLKYYGNLLENLPSKKNLKVTLLIDQNNEYLDKLENIKKFFIKTSFLKNLALNFINCEILIITTPDIGNTYVKKSNFCKHYFYIFHSPVSSQMVYNRFAFKNYDTVCCNGSYQYNELINEEKNFKYVEKVEDNEKETVILQRRSIRLITDKKNGEILTRNDIEFQRPSPSDSLNINEIDKVINKKINKNLQKGDYLKLDFFN